MVTVITMVALSPQTQDTAPPTSAPTIEQIRYQEGLKTATRGVAQIRDGLNRVARTQRADSLTRRRAARRLGGLCGTARTFIVSGRPKMQATACGLDPYFGETAHDAPRLANVGAADL